MAIRGTANGPPHLVGQAEEIWRELRFAVGGAPESQLLHAVPKRVGMQPQDFCRPARSFNDTLGLVQYCDDVTALDFFKCGGRRRSRGERLIQAHSSIVNIGGGAGSLKKRNSIWFQ